MTFIAFFDGVYLPAHRKPLTRYLHFVGSIGVVGFALVALCARDAWWLIGAPLWGYGFAWGSHFLAEKNLPETMVDFPRHVAQSLGGNFAMLFCWCVGALGANLAQSRKMYPEKWR